MRRWFYWLLYMKTEHTINANLQSTIQIIINVVHTDWYRTASIYMYNICVSDSVLYFCIFACVLWRITENWHQNYILFFLLLFCLMDFVFTCSLFCFTNFYSFPFLFGLMFFFVNQQMNWLFFSFALYSYRLKALTDEFPICN